jgi:hypothetical protein
MTRRKSIKNLFKRRPLKFRRLRKGDKLFKPDYREDNTYLAVIDTTTDRVVAYVSTDALFDEHGNFFKESW